MAPFNSVAAEFALVSLWTDVKSKPEDQERVSLHLPLTPSIRLAIACAAIDSNEFTDTTPPIRIPPAFTTDAAHYLLSVSRSNNVERQLLFLSTSTEFAGNEASVPRPLIAIYVPTDVARQLLMLSVSTNTSSVHTDPVTEVSPSFTETDAAYQLLDISKTNLVLTEEDALRQLLDLSKSSCNSIDLVHIEAVFSKAEIAVMEKLLKIFACDDNAQLHATASFGEDEFLTAHSLLNRFAFPKRQGPAVFEFSPGDVAAAHQLRALFACDDPKRAVGPIFLAFPDAQEMQLVCLSKSDNAARHLLELTISEGEDSPKVVYPPGHDGGAPDLS